MSQTPETDAEATRGNITDAGFGYLVGVDFARKIERERDEARVEIQRLKAAGTQYAAGWDDHVIASRAELNQLRAERDGVWQCALREGVAGGALADAAREHLNRYLSLVNSGDAGNWDPEAEPQVIALRGALKAFDRRDAPLTPALSPRPTKGEGEGAA